jgi:hypothetical protein
MTNFGDSFLYNTSSFLVYASYRPPPIPELRRRQPVPCRVAQVATTYVHSSILCGDTDYSERGSRSFFSNSFLSRLITYRYLARSSVKTLVIMTEFFCGLLQRDLTICKCWNNVLQSAITSASHIPCNISLINQHVIRGSMA